MTIHQLFSEPEQDLITTALEMYYKKCNTLANSSVKGYGSAKELDKKQEWANKAAEIEELQNKIVDLSI